MQCHEFCKVYLPWKGWMCYSTTCTADSIVTVSCRPSRMCLHLLAILTSPDVLPLAWCFVPESFDVHQLRNSTSECGQRWAPLLGWSSAASLHAPHLRDKNWALLNTDWVTKLHNIKLAFKTKEKNTTQVTFIYVSLVFICKTYGSSRRNPSTSTFFQQATGLSACPSAEGANHEPPFDTWGLSQLVYISSSSALYYWTELCCPCEDI